MAFRSRLALVTGLALSCAIPCLGSQRAVRLESQQPTEESAALTAGFGAGPTTLTRWGMAEGLPQSTVTCMEQDRDGSLWIGTFGGLARFDGASFEVFDLVTHPELQSIRILCLEQTPDGALWVGTESGALVRLKDGRFEHVLTMPRSEGVGSIHATVEGKLWISTNRHCYGFANGRLAAIYQGQGLVVCPDAEGGLWVSELVPSEKIHTRIYHMDAKQEVKTIGSMDTQVVEVQRSSDGTVWWIGRGGGLVCVRKDGGFKVDQVEPHNTFLSDAIAVTPGGQPVTCGPRGIRLWNGEELVTLVGPEEASFGDARDAFIDASGSLWMGGPFGLAKLTPTPLVGFPMTTPNRIDQTTMVPSGPNSVQVAARGWIQYPSGTELGGTGMPLIATSDSLGRIWALVDGPKILLLDQGTEVEPFPGWVAPQGCRVMLVELDDAGAPTLWMGSNDGLTRLRGTEETFWSTEDGLAVGAPRALLRDSEGALWIGTHSGLSRLDDAGGPIRTWTQEDGLPAGQVRALYQGERGDLWIGTYGGGLAYMWDGVLTTLTPQQGVPEPVVSAILPDGNGFLYLLGNQGIWRLREQHLQDVIDGSRSRLHALRFSQGPGIKSFEGEGGSQGCALKTADGALWFLTIEGVARLDPSRIFAPPPLSPARITQVTIDQQVQPLYEPISAPPGDRDIAVRFTAASFEHTESIVFRHRLVPYHENWIEEGQQRAGSYTQVPPGLYTLEVQASRLGDWDSAMTTTREIELRPAWHEIKLVRLGILGLALGWLLWRAWASFRRVELRRRELEDEVALRTEDLMQIRAGLEETVSLRTGQLEEDMKRREALARELERSQRLESVGRLAGGVAHDFNNTLAIITCEAYVLQSTLARKGMESERLNGSIGRLRAASDHGAKLTRQLLAYSGRQIVQPEVLDLNQVILDVRRMLRRLIAEPIQLEVELDPDAGWIRMDPGQIEQVIINLVVNASDAIEGPGTITLSTEGIAGENPQCLEGRVRISVSDTGSGIEESVQERVFEPFFSTKSAGRGTGLGLASVHGIVAQAQGEIRLESRVGEGTTFHADLPRVAAPTTIEPARRVSVPSVGQAHILVCEDQLELAEAVGLILRERGHQVTLATSPKQALEFLVNAPTCDLLISDMIMPGMDGLELWEQAQSLAPDLLVVFMTGHVLDPVKAAKLAEQRFALVRKPFTPEEILVAVARTLRGNWPSIPAH